MNKIFLSMVVLLGLAACAAPGMQTNEATHYNCDGGMAVVMNYQDDTRSSGVLTLSRVINGNVEARSITLARIAYTNGEAWSNNGEQTQWVMSGNRFELTYPVEGVVRMFQCKPVTL